MDVNGWLMMMNGWFAYAKRVHLWWASGSVPSRGRLHLQMNLPMNQSFLQVLGPPQL